MKKLSHDKQKLSLYNEKLMWLREKGMRTEEGEARILFPPQVST
jgi:hypothetical protein